MGNSKSKTKLKNNNNSENKLPGLNDIISNTPNQPSNAIIINPLNLNENNKSEIKDDSRINTNSNHRLNKENEPQVNILTSKSKEENLDTIQNEENNIDNNELNKKTNKKNKKLFIKPNIENLLMEATQHKINTDFRKFKFNGITVVQDLKDYFPKDITKDEVKELLLKAFGDGIVDDIKYYIPGKTVTKNQVNDIVNLVFDYIKEDLKMDDIHNANVLPGVNLIIDLVDLDRDIIRNKMFKGIEPTEIQLENTMKNLNGGLNYVKLLSIEFSE